MTLLESGLNVIFKLDNKGSNRVMTNGSRNGNISIAVLESQHRFDKSGGCFLFLSGNIPVFEIWKIFPN